MPQKARITFLVMTALKSEYDALTACLRTPADSMQGWVANPRFEPPKGRASFVADLCNELGEIRRIICPPFTGEGSDNMKKATERAINDWNPDCVILVGICGGFEHKGLFLGDVFVPEVIFPYERVKKEGAGTFEWRDYDRPVSKSLWNTAKPIAAEGTWHRHMRLPRPSCLHGQTPQMHCRGLLATGEKIVASDEKDQFKQWLITCRSAQTCGVECEGKGLADAASENGNKPYIVIKSVQDPADPKKDESQNDPYYGKDRWTPYACEASVVAAVEIMRSYVPWAPPEHAIAARKTYLDRINPRIPKPPDSIFTYTVSVAPDYTALRHRRFTLEELSPSRLLDLATDGTPIVLHGRAGAGKSSILWRLTDELTRGARIAIYLDLSKRIPQVPQLDSDKADMPREEDAQFRAKLDGVFSDYSVCTLTAADLFSMSQVSHVFIMVDGVNENAKRARRRVLPLLEKLPTRADVRIIVADRFTESDWKPMYLHVQVDPLPVTLVRDLVYGTCGKKIADGLSEGTVELLRIPFFLDLYLRKFRRGQFSTRSEMIRDYFQSQLSWSKRRLTSLARRVFAETEEYKSRDLRKLVSTAAGLSQAGIMEASFDGGTFRFVHQLWQDFLNAYQLTVISQADTPITSRQFDGVTFDAQSLDSVTLASEQCSDTQRQDRFMQAVYDWNFYAGFECIVEAGLAGRHICSDSIRLAVVSNLCEKRFDESEHTSREAMRRLGELADPESQALVESGTVDELVSAVARLPEYDAWFLLWRGIFITRSGEALDDESLERLYRDDDAIIGWTVANVARRGCLNEKQRFALRSSCAAYLLNSSAAKATESIRWRIVHALGAYTDPDNVHLFLQALDEDPAFHVKYGAARALVEQAAASTCKGDVALAKSIVDALEGRIKAKKMEPHVMIEVARTAERRNAVSAWYDTFAPITGALEKQGWSESQLERLPPILERLNQRARK